MPRYRKLHTRTVESVDVNDMPDDFTRLLWVLLPNKLCREGRGQDLPAWVRSGIFPLRDDVTLEMVQTAMDWYAERGMIVRYRVNGRGFFYAPSFAKYQGNTEKEAQSDYPAPPDSQEPVTTNSRPTPDLLQTNSCTDADANADSNANADAIAATPPRPPPKRPPKRRKSKTPIPAAVKAFREAAHRFPPKSWYGKIADAVGDDPADLAFFTEVVIAYIGLGWNPGNVKNMLEFYQRREVPKVVRNAKGANIDPMQTHKAILKKRGLSP